MNAEIEQTLKLKQLLKNRIEQSDGWIPFDLFFNTIMYEPGLGYYSSGSHKIGEGGDFTTAPLISNLFGEMLAIWCIAFWENLGYPKKINIVELGAGNGEMMHQMTKVFKKFEKFLKASKFFIFENLNFLSVNKNILNHFGF